MSHALVLVLVLTSLGGTLGTVSYAYQGVPSWFESGIEESKDWGIIPQNFSTLDFNQPITRGEFAEVVVLAYVSIKGDLPSRWTSNTFKDSANAYADMAYALQLISGYPDGTFGPGNAIKREEMFVMLHKLVNKFVAAETVSASALSHFKDTADVSPWAVDAASYAVSRGIVSGTDLITLEPRQNTTRAQALVIVKNTLKTLASKPVPLDQMNTALFEIRRQVSSAAAGTSTTQTVVSRGTRRVDSTTYTDAERLVMLGNNAVKYAYIFGSADAPRYATAQEALNHMVTIQVDVWQLGSDGTKTLSKRSLVVHKALADTFKAIFKEILEGPEKFPIKDVGGYAWRASATSEHRWGLAVDLNANENYMIRSDGTVVAGSFWKPGVSPYSIKPDGDVVRAFKKHGFSWGGDAWPSSHDYMHFSFLGN